MLKHSTNLFALHRFQLLGVKTIQNFAADAKLTTQVKKKIPRTERTISKEITLLKKQLAKKEPLKSESLYEKYHHKEVYQKINTEMESFFHKREYNVENFNFLINLLVEQKKYPYIEKVLQKMSLLQISPDSRTYNYLIKAASSQGNSQLAEQTFRQATKYFIPNKYFYTTLIQCYVNNSNSYMAHAIMKEMTQKGIVADLPVYTSVINSYRKERNLAKCWEIHREVTKKNIGMDQTYVGVMMKVYAATHDVEKCVKMYKENILDRGIKPMVETKNAYIKALACRAEYSQQAIDLFFQMYQNGEIITRQTVQYALKACSTSASIISAIEIIKIMNILEIVPDKPIYNALFRVYGKVCTLPNLDENYRQIVIMDTFRLLEEIQSKQSQQLIQIDTTLLNNVMYVLSSSDQKEKIDGLVLPMFEKLNLGYNVYTFEILMESYYRTRDFNMALRIWQECKIDIEKRKRERLGLMGAEQVGLLTEGKDIFAQGLPQNTSATNSIQNVEEKSHQLAKREQFRLTFKMVHMYLEIGIKMMDMKMVLNALKLFKGMNRPPKNETLKFLGNLENLPEEILTSLMEFKIKFGKAKLSKKKNVSTHIDDPQNIK